MDDGHQSRYPASWLAEHAYDDAARRSRAFIPRPWDDVLRRKPPMFNYAEILDDDAALFQVLSVI